MPPFLPLLIVFSDHRELSFDCDPDIAKIPFSIGAGFSDLQRHVGDHYDQAPDNSVIGTRTGTMKPLVENHPFTTNRKVSGSS